MTYFLLTHPVKSLDPSHPYSCLSTEALAKLKITRSHILLLKPDLEKRLSGVASLGKDKFWSSTNLCHHLEFLSFIDRKLTEVCY